MRYEKPEFVEIKMDAEIGSYQNDFDDPSKDPAFVEQQVEVAHPGDRPRAVPDVSES